MNATIIQLSERKFRSSWMFSCIRKKITQPQYLHMSRRFVSERLCLCAYLTLVIIVTHASFHFDFDRVAQWEKNGESDWQIISFALLVYCRASRSNEQMNLYHQPSYQVTAVKCLFVIFDADVKQINMSQWCVCCFCRRSRCFSVAWFICLWIIASSQR